MTAPSNDDRVKTAAAIVNDLREANLNFSEIGRLCHIASQVEVCKRLAAGTCKVVSQDTVTALQEGYERFLQGDTSFRKLRGSRPKGETGEALPATEPQSLLRIPGARLWDRIVERNKERDAA